jgi:hypothetical protein
MVSSLADRYTTKIIKAGALLADTKTLLANYDPVSTVAQNFDRFRRENIFGKASRSRVEDILAIFRQRYLGTPDVAEALATLARASFPAEALDRLLYFHAAQSDPLLHDIVTEYLYDRQAAGRADVSANDICRVLNPWAADGQTAEHWSEPTTVRVAQGLLATLRDFAVLDGALHKRIAPVYLPVEAFSYVAFYLWQRQPSGERLLEHPDWRLFFLARPAVEHALMEAHQRRLLEYYAAGSVIRIAFPASALSEYAHVIAQAAL